MKLFQQFLACCFFCFLPLLSFAEAPVVDDSENFAMLDETQEARALNERPVAKPEGKYSKYSDTEEEMALAQDNDNSQSSNVDWLAKLKGMQQELQELRGQLEVQAHELKLLQQQQLTFYKDIDARFKSNAPTSKGSNTLSTLKEQTFSEAPSANLTLSAPKTADILPSKTQAPHHEAQALSTHTNNPADEQIAYLAAYDLVKNKRYDEAMSSMEHFVSQYPKGGYTANAQYWLGELYIVKKNYAEAIHHFELVLKNFSNSSKAAPSSLKIGYALASSGRKEEAIQRLQQVVENYPDTPTAQLAVTKLMSINATT